MTTQIAIAVTIPRDLSDDQRAVMVELVRQNVQGLVGLDAEVSVLAGAPNGEDALNDGE